MRYRLDADESEKERTCGLCSRRIREFSGGGAALLLARAVPAPRAFLMT